MLNSFRLFRLFVLVCFIIAYYYGTTDPEPQRIKASRAKRMVMPDFPEKECNDSRHIAFIFDHEPKKNTTPLILDALDANNIKATFHISTQLLNQEAHAAIARRIYDAGHVIGLSYKPSRSLSTMKVDQVKAEVVEQAEIIKRFIGVYPRYIRLDSPESSGEVETAISAMGYVFTYWNLVSASFRPCQRVLDSTGAEVGEYQMSIYSYQRYRIYGNLFGAIIAIQHDICHIETFYSRVVYSLESYSFDLVTLDKCLGHDNPYKYAADREGTPPGGGNGDTADSEGTQPGGGNGGTAEINQNGGTRPGGGNGGTGGNTQNGGIRDDGNQVLQSVGGGTGGNTQNGGTQDNGKQGSQSVGGGSGASSVQVSLSMMVSAVFVGMIGLLMV